MTDTVTVSSELLRQVLEALEQADKRDGVYSYRCEIDALRAALKQPAPDVDLPDFIAGAFGVSRGTAYDMMREALPAPAERTVQQPQPVAEVRAHMLRGYEDVLPRLVWLPDEHGSHPVVPIGTKLYTAQPRKAVKLSDSEVEDLFLANAGYGGTDFWSVSRAIEQAVWAKLGVTE